MCHLPDCLTTCPLHFLFPSSPLLLGRWTDSPTWQLMASNSFARSLKAMISVGQTNVKSSGGGLVEGQRQSHVAYASIVCHWRQPNGTGLHALTSHASQQGLYTC